MAEQTTGRGKGAKPAEDEERVPTKRTILKRERVLVLPEDVIADPEKVAAILKAVSETKHIKSPQTTPAWVVMGEEEGESKRKAIEAFAGVAGTPEAKPGAWKAPTSSAWSDGRVHERPPEPKIEGSDLED